MLPVITSAEEHVNLLLSLPRPGEEHILAWYEHRLGAISCNPRLMLAPLDDHLVHRGDGIFEAIKYEQAKIFSFDSHLERMRRSAESIYLAPPCPWEEIRSNILDVAAAGGEQQGLIRILLGRGPGGFGITTSECPVSSLYIAAYRYTPRPDTWYSTGLTSFRSSIPAKQGYIAKIKNANYLPNVLMMLEAQQRGFDVPLCFDEEGYLAESAIANIALVTKGVLEVPEGKNALLGTTIERILALVQGSLEYRVRPITEEDIRNADELLMFGSSPGCVALVAYENTPVGSGKPGPVSQLLRQRIVADALANGTPIPGLM